MTSRERVRLTLAHREPDRVPIDMGTPVTSIHAHAYAALREHLGLSRREPDIIDAMQQASRIHEEVLQRFQVDTRQVFLKSSRPWKRLAEDLFVDEWGVQYRPSADGRYYDMWRHPLAQATLADLASFPWPDPDDPVRYEGLVESTRRLREGTEYAIVLNGFNEALFGLPSWVRGHAQFYMDLVADREFAEAYLDRFLAFALRLAENALSRIGSMVDVVRVADDLGSERGPIVSPATYRSLIKPRQKKLYDFIKSKTDAPILLHSCGSVRDLIDDFIEIGVDALNPVQVAARGMDSKELKSVFGHRISFWGGGCDTQRVLPFGSVEEVRREVMRRIADLSPGGGFVFSPVHNIQYDVSPEKICALYDAAIEHGAYTKHN